MSSKRYMDSAEALRGCGKSEQQIPRGPAVRAARDDKNKKGVCDTTKEAAEEVGKADPSATKVAS